MVRRGQVSKEENVSMGDYVKRFLIAIILAICVSLLFLGGKPTHAAELSAANEKEKHWIWPADGIISDTYGTRNGKHKGIDIAGTRNTPILAVEDGIVVKSYYSKTYGNVVFIKHPSNFVTVYAHLNKRNVFQGNKIKQGHAVGTMGNTGQATGTHLHFETHQMEWRYDKKFALDPEFLLGKMAVGDSVQGGIASAGDVLEVSLRLQPQIAERPSIKSNTSTSAAKYIVKQGDTLYSIAKQNNLTVARIKEMNQLSSDIIRPKQILIIR